MTATTAETATQEAAERELVAEARLIRLGPAFAARAADVPDPGERLAVLVAEARASRG
jgi:hypothetical protein